MTNTNTPDTDVYKYLNMREAGYYVFLTQLADSNGILAMSQEEITAKFKNGAQPTVHRVLNSLVKSGWIEVLAKNSRDGHKYFPTKYRIVPVAEWIVEHAPNTDHKALAAYDSNTELEYDPAMPKRELNVSTYRRDLI
jgi:SOS-response transcriptional repressor LexA